MITPDPPVDLIPFWSELVSEALAAPLDGTRSVHPVQGVGEPGFRVETLSFRGMDGGARHGWIAVPEGGRHVPAFLWIPPYSRWSMKPNAYGTRPGYASMSFNFFGESAFHDEVYRPERGYFADGADDPSTWVFRRMTQDAILALRWLRVQVEVDENRLAAAGMSQGGGMAIWLGAVCELVRCVAADMPFLAGTRWMFAQRVHRYPLKELVDFMDSFPMGRETVLNTLAYFDTVHLAQHCRVPTLVSLGQKDPAVRPEQVRAVHEVLPGEKSLVEYDWGHDWHPDMVRNNQAWFDRWLG